MFIALWAGAAGSSLSAGRLFRLLVVCPLVSRPGDLRHGPMWGVFGEHAEAHK